MWPARTLAAGAIVWAAATLIAPAGTWLDDQVLEHDGLPRRYRVYEPAVPPPPAGHPLVFVLHGGTGDMYDVMKNGAFAEWPAIADEQGVLLAVPNGVDPDTGDPAGTNQSWNDCRLPGSVPRTDADDVGFISALVDELAARYPIDTERIYATGPSNGGQMSYRLALELGWRVAAVAPFIATLPVASECLGPSQPVAVMICNGDADPYTNWNGGCASNDPQCERGEKLSAFATRDFWIAVNGANPVPSETVAFPDVNPDDGCTVESQLHAGGIEGVEVAFYRVWNGGHVAPTIAHPYSRLALLLLGLGNQNEDIESAREAWAFFERHTLHGEGPNDAPGGVGRLIVVRGAGQTLSLSWDPDCGGGGRYAVYRGDLSVGYESIAREPGMCDLDVPRAELPLGEASDFFLVVPHDGNVEGSYGRDGAGSERNPPADACHPGGAPDACAAVGLH